MSQQGRLDPALLDWPAELTVRGRGTSTFQTLAQRGQSSARPHNSIKDNAGGLSPKLNCLIREKSDCFRIPLSLLVNMTILFITVG